jgi:hypothetical protein
MLAMSMGIAEQSQAREMVDAMKRSWTRPEGAARVADLYRSIEHVVVKSPAGLVMGAAPAVHIDGERVSRVLNRVVLGLFRHETGCVLPPEYSASVSQTATDPETRAMLATHFSSRPTSRLGSGNEFSYRWVAASDDASTTEWLLTFYNRITLYGVTLSEVARRRSADAA